MLAFQKLPEHLSEYLKRTVIVVLSSEVFQPIVINSTDLWSEWWAEKHGGKKVGGGKGLGTLKGTFLMTSSPYLHTPPKLVPLSHGEGTIFPNHKPVETHASFKSSCQGDKLSKVLKIIHLRASESLKLRDFLVSASFPSFKISFPS